LADELEFVEPNTSEFERTKFLNILLIVKRQKMNVKLDIAYAHLVPHGTVPIHPAVLIFRKQIKPRLDCRILQLWIGCSDNSPSGPALATVALPLLNRMEGNLHARCCRCPASYGS